MAKKYWLFKSEPGCYSIDDLKKCKNSTDHWDGVRNYQARNMLRDDIKKDDEVFFYYSNAKPMGVAGVCTVVKNGYPDHTAEDPDSEHPDPKHTKNNPIWYMVDVKFKEKFNDIVTLKEIKETSGLEEMVLTQRGSRLSIQPVKKKEWDIILKMAKKK
ncbi:MAG: EVE domain-containing protein [Calditrichaeota bacterium]|nr:MAG: EVE domain-containing protein [Calditrichota bacterium]